MKYRVVYVDIDPGNADQSKSTLQDALNTLDGQGYGVVSVVPIDGGGSTQFVMICASKRETPKPSGAPSG